MSDQPGSRDTPTPASQPPAPPRMPRWVFWPAIALGVLVLAFVVLGLFGLEHGPGLHSPGGDNAPASPDPGHTPPRSHG